MPNEYILAAASECAADPGGAPPHGRASPTGSGRSRRLRNGSRSMRRRYASGGTVGSLRANLGLQDRSSRPHRSPNRTGRQLRRKVCRIRRKRRWGAAHIAHEVGLAASTVQNILNAAGEGRLDRGDRATDREPIHRYERDLPGESIHVDIKKIAAIPNGGGWRVRGRGDRR